MKTYHDQYLEDSGNLIRNTHALEVFLKDDDFTKSIVSAHLNNHQYKD